MESKQFISLETVLEIEGLVMLINDRRERTPRQVYDLISSKLETVRAEIEMLRNEYPLVENETEKTNSCGEEINEEINKEEPEVLPADSNEDMEEIAESTELEEEEDADPSSEPQVVTASEHEKHGDVTIISPEIPPVPVTTSVDTTSVSKTEIPRFSLNDKYVFRRELFNFSDEEMTEALNVASKMTSVEEVEDYFYNDLCWDPENEIVRHFISIITARFKSRGY